jgi:hypothetical protein
MRRAGIAVLLLVLPTAGCQARADLVVLNGVVWTGAFERRPTAGGSRVRGGRILLVRRFRGDRGLCRRAPRCSMRAADW